ncbi:MAG: hypothetical protein FVQ80_11445 [Planctomycetes bacterium]|nr:hypothetical protein [Planctomycetota bacterium]
MEARELAMRYVIEINRSTIAFGTFWDPDANGGVGASVENLSFAFKVTKINLYLNYSISVAWPTTKAVIVQALKNKIKNEILPEQQKREALLQAIDDKLSFMVEI